MQICECVNSLFGEKQKGILIFFKAEIIIIDFISRFACAQARLKTGSRYYTVCTYDPFGNVVGQFRSNVLPPLAIAVNSSINSTTDRTTTINILTTTTQKPTTTTYIAFFSSTQNNSTTNDQNADLHEATLNVSPQELPNADLTRPSTLVKPILNKSYRLSPGMLVKLKNLNKRKLESNTKNVDDKVEASASELNLFIKSNTISPTMNIMEISNLIKRKNETYATIYSTETKAPVLNNDDLLTTIRSL